MAEPRRKFDADFREGAVRLVRETGKPIAQVARDLGINEGTLGNWVNADRRRRGDGTGAPAGHRRGCRAYATAARTWRGPVPRPCSSSGHCGTWRVAARRGYRCGFRSSRPSTGPRLLRPRRVRSRSFRCRTEAACRDWSSCLPPSADGSPALNQILSQAHVVNLGNQGARAIFGGTDRQSFAVWTTRRRGPVPGNRCRSVAGTQMCRAGNQLVWSIHGLWLWLRPALSPTRPRPPEPCFQPTRRCGGSCRPLALPPPGDRFPGTSAEHRRAKHRATARTQPRQWVKSRAPEWLI